ncbi:25S rRNA (adenine2142-N1)-methyltransferase [Entomortierella parvispora]|uniref:25S rRNA adenine-N(1) methyltransferase n=1 Tax=Entomortierella parvispora TaxID=205924 RepID=A0A9P3HIM1_9FUNG|nr:25S rRNA (adenine2142-N1)-methyltransferase [Entomortierella parvispora]
MAIAKKPKRSVTRRKRPVTADAGVTVSSPTMPPTIASSSAADPVALLLALTPSGADTTSKTSSLLTITSSKTVARKKSSLATAQLIRRYHTLNKELSQCLARIEKSKEKTGPARNATNGVSDLARIAEIRKEMDDLGGLDMYQKASTLGQSKQRGGDSSKWLIPVIEKCYDKLDKKAGPPLKLLDIGALSPHNYQKYSSWIKTTPIDLNPQDPLITKMDFLEMPVPSKPADLFNVVCLSLVVNFVGDPAQRGQILRHSTQFLVPGTGLLYLVLPLPCIQNSRYMDHELLVDMMDSIGYSTVVDHHFAKKLAYYVFKLDARPSGGKKGTKPFPKKMRHDKPNRNNFCIVLT